MINNCQDLAELITDFLEGRLGLVDRVLFRVHIAGCPNCRTYVSQMRDTVEGLDDVAPPAMPDDVRDELLERFRDWKRS